MFDDYNFKEMECGADGPVRPVFSPPASNVQAAKNACVPESGAHRIGR